MEEIPVTRAYLESLTTSELIRMADTWGIDIPPDLDRIFIIEELLESASEDTAETAETASFFSDEPSVPGEPKAADSDETAPLPRQYNITFIEVMIRDPLWAFVFWEIKAADKEQLEKAQDLNGYYLKVSPFDKPAGASGDSVRRPDEADGIFTVPVKSDDNSWYLGLGSVAEEARSRTVLSAEPTPSKEKGSEFPDQRQYKVELCVDRRGEETVIAVSKPFRLPPLHELPGGFPKQEPNGARENPLLRLSGFGDFTILRSNERLFRAKGGVSAASYE